MALIYHDVAVDKWPKMPQVVNEAAAQLQAQYGEADIPGEVLKRKIEEIGDYRKDSVIPSDYCYNRLNLAPFSFKYLVLVHLRRGWYKYIGSGYPYNGPVMWKPKQERERQVGVWKDGDCDLWEDLRQPLNS